MTVASQPPVKVEDNLSNDLVELVASTGISLKDQNAILTKLVPYIIERDHKILIHGYESGRASA